MKKSNKRILFTSIGVVVVAVAVLIVNFYPVLSMKPAETGIIDNTPIIAVKNNANSLYFVKLIDEYILIDAGTDAASIEKSIIEENINPSFVKYILLTHTDSDHVASLNLFPNAEIYLNEDELQMINGITNRNGNKSNTLPEGINHDALILLKDEQVLEFGEHKIKCIKAPGHTLGSMVFVLDGEYVFSGDTFKVTNNNIIPHPFSMDEEVSRNSIEKLEEIIKSSKLVLTAHYGYYESSKLRLD